MPEKPETRSVTGRMSGGTAQPTGSRGNQASKPAPPKTLKSVSIKSFTKPESVSASQKVEESGEEISKGNNGIDPDWEESFSPERLQQIWTLYARSVEKSNPRMFSMLTAHSPRLKGNNMVVFPLKNETQEVELLKEKGNLFNFLKKELKNAKLQLEIEYIREESGSQKAYTAADKYKVLAEKNPTLDKLRNMLNLDIE